MEDNQNVDKWTLEDGRKAEKRVINVPSSEEGVSEIITEFHVEPPRHLNLEKKIIERKKPFVFERVIQEIDPSTGEVKDQKIESVEPKVQMHFVEHIVAEPEVSAQKAEEDCDCHVTREEMVDAIISAIKISKEAKNPVEEKVVANHFDSSGISSLGIAEEIEKRINSSTSDPDFKSNVVLVLMTIQVLALFYMVFFM
ncbi:MAG: hypothetical protein EKK64_03325 [Neisseriaceae bacterium]|nr:MAG: hypothetical protein EKK64_03325 [Neisseriaceae bacterium]